MEPLKLKEPDNVTYNAFELDFGLGPHKLPFPGRVHLYRLHCASKGLKWSMLAQDNRLRFDRSVAAGKFRRPGMPLAPDIIKQALRRSGSQ